MKKKVLLILLVAIMTLSACGSSDEKATDGKKVFRIAKDTAVKTLDTSLATDGMSFDVMENFVDGLVDYDAEGKIMPRAAESWEKSEDGLVYTFKIREDAVWSNGDPVTANDFVFNWQRVVDPATAAEYAVLIIDAGIKNAEAVNTGELDKDELGVKALDDKTLEVTLEDTVPYFLEFITFPIFNPLNEKFFNEAGSEYAKTPEGLISNGPFVITEWTPGSSITLEKNETYVDADDVKIDGVEYKIISDYQTAALEFDNGKLDYAKVSSDLVDRYENKGNLEKMALGYLWYIAPNQLNEDLANADLRLALGHAVDRDHLVDDIMGDGSLAAEYIVPKGLAVGPDGEDFRKAGGTYQTYDIDKANEHLEKAKAALNKDAFELDLLIEDSEEARTNAEAIQSDLQALEDVTVTITTVPKSERLDRMREGDYDLGLTRWGPDYADPYTYLGTLFTTGATYNQARYSNADYDALIEKLGVGGELADQPEARWEGFVEAEKILLEEAGVIPVWQSSEAFVVSDRVDGIELHVVGMPSYRNVTIEE